jgi:hypothetical protein
MWGQYSGSAQGVNSTPGVEEPFYKTLTSHSSILPKHLKLTGYKKAGIKTPR